MQEVEVTYQDETVSRFAVDRPDLEDVYDRAYAGEVAAQRLVRQMVGERYRAAKIYAVHLLRDRRLSVET